MQHKEIEALKYFDFPIKHFHDRSTRWLLEDHDNVRGLLEIVADNLVAELDFEQLKHINRSFIPDNLREQESDLVYSVPYRSSTQKEELLIYILIEHQSTVDITMGFRVLFYMTQIWDAQRRDWQSNNIPKSQWRLRPIVPIVLYTGDQKWEALPSLSALMDLPDIFSRFVPKYDTLFLSVKETDTSDLTKTDHPFGWLLTVLQKEHASKEDISNALLEAVRRIDTLEPEKRDQWHRAIFYLYLLILHRRPNVEHDELKMLVHQQIQESSHKEEGEVMAQSMAEYLYKQGKEEGETLAKREVILKLLQLRFASVPDTIANKITSIENLSQLETLFEKAATAQTLDEIDLDDLGTV